MIKNVGVFRQAFQMGANTGLVAAISIQMRIAMHKKIHNLRKDSQ